MFRKCSLIGAVVGCCVLVGCGAKLNVDETVEISPTTGGKQFTVEAIGNEQKIKVSVTSEKEVSVYIYLKRDQGKDGLTPAGEKILAKKDKATSIELEASIPAKEEAVVEIQPSLAKTKATLKIRN